MAEELDLPDEIYGFGSWLLWVLATRATSGSGPGVRGWARAPVPAVRDGRRASGADADAESGIPPDRLTQRDRRLDQRQKVLRTIVSGATSGEPRLFKESWLRQLAAVGGLGETEMELLARCRDD